RGSTRVWGSWSWTSNGTHWMPEIRVDPLSGHKTIVAGERSARPGGEPCAPPAQPIDAERDPFAEGHEDRTPPELYAVRPDGGPGGSGVGGIGASGIGGGTPNTPGWTVRVVPNLYPALTPADHEGGGEGDRSEIVEPARGRPE